MNKSFHFYLAMLVLFSITEIYGSTNPLLHCLAKEEESLFKAKETGANYRLNQMLMNELASSDDISLKANYVEQACSATNRSTAVAVLKLLLLRESDVYDFSALSATSSTSSYKKGYAYEFQKQVPRIFIQYLSWLQADMATANCLTNAIPELTPFLEKVKYLEEDLTAHELIADKKKIETIFSKLEYVEKIKRGCVKKSQRKKGNVGRI